MDPPHPQLLWNEVQSLSDSLNDLMGSVLIMQEFMHAQFGMKFTRFCDSKGRLKRRRIRGRGRGGRQECQLQGVSVDPLSRDQHNSTVRTTVLDPVSEDDNERRERMKEHSDSETSSASEKEHEDYEEEEEEEIQDPLMLVKTETIIQDEDYDEGGDFENNYHDYTNCNPDVNDPSSSTSSLPPEQEPEYHEDEPEPQRRGIITNNQRHQSQRAIRPLPSIPTSEESNYYHHGGYESRRSTRNTPSTSSTQPSSNNNTTRKLIPILPKPNPISVSVIPLLPPPTPLEIPQIKEEEEEQEEEGEDLDESTVSESGSTSTTEDPLGIGYGEVRYRDLLSNPARYKDPDYKPEKKRSKIYEYFEFHDDDMMYHCLHCNAGKYRTPKGGGTGSLHNHLRLSHPQLVAEMKAYKKRRRC